MYVCVHACPVWCMCTCAQVKVDNLYNYRPHFVHVQYLWGCWSETTFILYINWSSLACFVLPPFGISPHSFSFTFIWSVVPISFLQDEHLDLTHAQRYSHVVHDTQRQTLQGNGYHFPDSCSNSGLWVENWRQGCRDNCRQWRPGYILQSNTAETRILLLWGRVVVTVGYGLRTTDKAVETTEDSEDQVIYYNQTLQKPGYCFSEGGL